MGKKKQKDHFKQMGRTMEKQFKEATDDFKTIGPTQKKLHKKGEKFQMGSIAKPKRR